MSNSAFAGAVSGIREKWKTHNYLRLSVYIIATSLVLYWQFIFGDKVFVFSDTGSDTLLQYNPTYEFFSSGIKNGTLSSYTFQYGYGKSLFSMLTWLMDPFTMISIAGGAVFGTEFISESLVYVRIMQHICAGLTCFYFLKDLKFSSKSSMLSAYVYAFAGYITTVGYHYFFSTLPFYFILFLILLEKIIQGENKIKYWCGLVCISALVCLKGATTAYVQFIAAAVYALFRTIFIYKKDIKKTLQRLSICLSFVVIGICISSCLFFPQMGSIISSNRLVHDGNYLAISFDNFKSNILRLFSNLSEGTFNTWYGGRGHFAHVFTCFYSVMLVPLSAQYIWRTFKDKFTIWTKVFRILPVVIVLFTICSDFIPYLFTFFVSPYHRFIYIFLPFYAVLFSDVLDNINIGKFSRITNWLVMTISLVIIVWGGIVTYNKGNSVSLMLMMSSGTMLVFGCISLDLKVLMGKDISNLRLIKIKKNARIAFASVIVLNLFCENYIIFNYQRTHITKKQVQTHLVLSDVIEEVNNEEKENFFRFELVSDFADGRMEGRNYGLMFPVRTSSFYDTTVSKDFLEFYNKMFQSPSWWHYNNYLESCIRCQNNITEDILGIKYLLLSSDPQRDGWEKIAEYPEKGVALFKNLGLNSAGLLFDSYVTQEDADKMSFYERSLGMSQRLILDSPLENIGDYAKYYTQEEPSQNLGEAVYANNTSVYLGEVKSINMMNNKYDISIITESDESTVSVPLNTEIVNSSQKATQVTFEFKGNDIIKNFMYLDADTKWHYIVQFDPVKESENTKYTFMLPQKALMVAFAVNKGGEINFSVSSETVTAAYTNEGIQLDNPDRGDTLTGTVTAQKNSLLYLPVLYNRDWNAYVDGEKVEIIKANYAFSAIPITAGQHRVDFIYSNQTYHKFQKVSIVSFVITNGFFVVYAVIRKKRGKNRERIREEEE